MSYILTPENSQQFTIGKHQFALSFQEDEMGGFDIAVIENSGGTWGAWGGANNSMIAEMFTTEQIKEHGSLKEFIRWCMSEAVKRAKLRAGNTIAPGSDNFARAKYAIANCLREDPVSGLALATPWDGGTPLPGA